LAELSDRYGVSTRTLQAHFEKHGTVKGSKAREIAAAVKEEVFGEMLDDPDLKLKRAKETREAAYRNAVVVENLVMAQLHDAQKDPATAYKAAAAIKTLSLAAATLERTHTLKWSALGLDRDSALSDELPVLILQDLTKKEIEQMRASQTEDDVALDLGVDSKAAEQPDDIVSEDGDERVRRPSPPPIPVATDADGFRLVRGASPG
jgi:arsenate reductase-like glutaredoxin family protein